MIKEDTTNSEPNSGVGLLGDYLKQKRLDKNYSLEKLSQKTKISVNILKNLEANDFDHLPSAAYIKGFVTSYVKVLGLPVNEAINKMEYTYLTVLGRPFPALNHTKAMQPGSVGQRPVAPVEEAPSEEEATPQEVIQSSESIIENTKSVLPVAILAVVILLFVGGYKLVSSIVETEVADQKTQDLGPKMEPSSALMNIQERTRPEPTVEQKPEPEVPAEKPAEVVKATPAEKAEPVSEATEDDDEEAPQAATVSERNYPPIDFKKIRGKLFTVVTDAPENDDLSLLPDAIKSRMNPSLQNVYIKAVGGSTWLSYKVDAKPISSIIIDKGGDLFLQGSDIRVFLGNVGVTKIFYNNYLINTPSKTGVKSLVFPEENNEKYVMPLFPKAKDDILYTAEEYQKRMKLEESELAKKKSI